MHSPEHRGPHRDIVLAERAAPSESGERPQVDAQQLAGALHEVSNALTVVLGWLDEARRLTGEGPARPALEVARSHADLGYRLARSAIGAEVGQEPERRAVSVARDALLGVTQEARRASIEVMLETPPKGELWLRDGAAALQVLVNLLLNAIAFSPPGGAVTLEVREAGKVVVFRVTDQGPGIPPDRVDSLLEGPPSTRRGGAGIGLRHSATIAEQKGGRLELVRPGPGAAFDLTWPASDLASGAFERPHVVSLEATRIVVVEDDPNVLALVEIALEARGATVLSASCPSDLAELLAGPQTFDAALVDLSPFRDSGQELLADLANRLRSNALVVMSGLVGEAPAPLIGRVARWVRKPFEVAEVVAAVRAVLPS